MTDPLAPPPNSRNPDTVFVATLLLISGLGILLSGVQPASVDALVPHAVAVAWAFMLAAGAGVTLAGVMWPARLTGLLLEGVGRTVLAPASLAYAVALIALVNRDPTKVIQSSASISISLLVALSLSSAWRLWQIHRYVAGVRAALREMQRRQERP